MRTLMVVAAALALGCGAVENDELAPAEVSSAATSLRLQVVRVDAAHRVLAATRDGTILAQHTGKSASRLFASSDEGRTWTQRTLLANGVYFKVMTVLESGALLADTADPFGAHAMMRSSDGGTTWTTVLPLGDYRWLQPHSVAELDGVVFFAEYQAFSRDPVAITLFASIDDGRTFRPRHVWTDRRHAHSLVADPATHTLWCFLGDSTGGLMRSRDGGSSWTSVVEGPAGVAVDGLITPAGHLVYGNDLVYAPGPNKILRYRTDGVLQTLATLPGPSYSVQHRSTRGYLLGETREPIPEGTPSVYDPADIYARLYGSGDTLKWSQLLALPRVDASDYARIDVHWQLPSGLAIVELRNVSGYGVNGTGFLLVKTTVY